MFSRKSDAWARRGILGGALLAALLLVLSSSALGAEKKKPGKGNKKKPPTATPTPKRTATGEAANVPHDAAWAAGWRYGDDWVQHYRKDPPTESQLNALAARVAGGEGWDGAQRTSFIGGFRDGVHGLPGPEGDLGADAGPDQTSGGIDAALGGLPGVAGGGETTSGTTGESGSAKRKSLLDQILSGEIGGGQPMTAASPSPVPSAPPATGTSAANQLNSMLGNGEGPSLPKSVHPTSYPTPEAPRSVLTVEKVELAGMSWYNAIGPAEGEARTRGCPVLIDFSAPWCGWCKKMEQETLTDSRVQARLKDFVLLAVNTDHQQSLADRYGVKGLPTTVIINSEGKVLASHAGYMDPDAYLTFLNGVSTSKPKATEKPKAKGK